VDLLWGGGGKGKNMVAGGNRMVKGALHVGGRNLGEGGPEEIQLICC